jgi:hypothetical protein
MAASAERPCRPVEGPELWEVVTPRTNATPISAVARLLAAGAVAQPFSLEIAGTPEGRHFLLRAQAATLHHLGRQLAAAYPQAALRPLPVAHCPSLDPALLLADEQVATCAFVLRAPPYLPLRTFRDADLAAERTPQADPVLAILGALAGLPDGWRGLSQLVLHPAPPAWADGYRRLTLDQPLAERSTASPSGPSATAILAMAALVALLGLGPLALRWYQAADWLHLGLGAGGLAAGIVAAVLLKARLSTPALADPVLVREKLGHGAYRAQLRLAVVAPAGATAADLLGRLDSLAAAYAPFGRPDGNSLRQCALRLHDHALTGLDPLARRPRLLPWLPGRPATALLNTQELAGLWHLPPAQADVPFLERTTARRWAPLPATVASGCRIGAAEEQGRVVPVALPEELLGRHLLLVAKTRRGKSSLLLRLAQHVMERRDQAAPALVLVDPHGDLARAALGLVPPGRRADVVYLDVAAAEHPFGLNLLDTGLGWDAERAVANALSVFRHQWDQYWGPRMEDIFRMALHTLYAANAARCSADPAARALQHTVLEIPTLLADPAFRKVVVEEGGDPFIQEWWQTFYDRLLDRRLQLESINPVLTKVNRLAASGSSRGLLGQPCSTIAPAAWLSEGRLVIVHTAQGIVGDDTAALVGGTLLNLLKLEVQGQAALPPPQRRRVTVVVDELHTMPGADYEAFLGELAKYGANLVLATQTLARLKVLDRAHERALRPTLFANLDGLFAFHVSAEDATDLVPELGGELEVADLVSLGEHQCYARMSVGGERLPVFSVQLDPPPASDAALAAQLAAASAGRYGRPRAQVEAVRQAALARVAALHQRVIEQTQTAHAAEEPPPPPSDGEAGRRPRNQHRERGGRRGQPHGLRLPLDDAATAPVDEEAVPEVEEREGRA